MRILSVDDNSQNRYLIEAVGRAHGYEVISAGNGLTALEALEQQLPDLIVSDILMPEMDGFQFCHEVKTHERTRHLPFIIYTATYTAKQDQELAMSLGASRFIVKPMDPEQFMDVIEEVVEEARRGKAVPEVAPVETIDYLKSYTSRLVCKLDRKIEQLEASRQALRESLAARDREIAQRQKAEAERTRLEAQFLHAQKLESIGRLAGGIAHDFNNLLTVINARSELLLEQLDPANSMRHPIEEIYKAGEHAAQLTRQLLAFSRRQVIHAEAMNLSRVVEEIRGMIQSLVGDDVEVVTELSAAGQVMVDEGQIHQVLLNLVVNARDAMPHGGRLTIQTARVEETAVREVAGCHVRPGPYILLSVKDSGTGMDPETLAHIFEPFYTTKAEGLGTGLGLSTVYGIVRQNGGWIQVESEPGHGSTFHIGLPEHAVQVIRTEAAKIATGQATGTETVLVVEDYSNVRLIIVAILKSYGYQVLEAANGMEALAIAEGQNRPIDLLVSDVQMPRMNGPELARQLRMRQPNLRVLFVSAHGEGSWSEELLTGPGISWITKPFLPDALAVQVRKLLDAPAKGRGAADKM